jgi:hypothetical protein
MKSRAWVAAALSAALATGCGRNASPRPTDAAPPKMADQKPISLPPNPLNQKDKPTR